MPNPPTAEVLKYSMAWDAPEAAPTHEVAPTPWRDALAGWQAARTYWLTTLRPNGSPHVVPLLGVVVDDAIHFCTSDRSRKASNIAADPRCVITASSATLDLVAEGTASAVREDVIVRRAAEAYAAKYGWSPDARDGGLWADGAPSAGPPPYRVYRVIPEKAFGFPTDDASVPTRWRF